jgi:hypothetical protein
MKKISKLNIGHSSRTGYDKCYYPEKLEESVGPGSYRLNPNSIHNCSQCLSTLGPRSSYMGQGVSTAYGHPVATSQKLVDVESVLTNRNLKSTKCRKDEVNPIDVTKYGVKHMRVCSKYLDPEVSRLTYPTANYRDMAINRFYNLDRNPQANIFYDFSINTKLEAKDNFIMDVPEPWVDQSHPNTLCGTNRPIKYAHNAHCKQPSL